MLKLTVNGFAQQLTDFNVVLLLRNTQQIANCNNQEQKRYCMVPEKESL